MPVNVTRMAAMRTPITRLAASAEYLFRQLGSQSLGPPSRRRCRYPCSVSHLARAKWLCQER